MKETYNFIYRVTMYERNGYITIYGKIGTRRYYICDVEKAKKLYNTAAVEELRKRGDL